MTGRDLIVYILQNGLENEEIFKDGKFIGLKTVCEVAEELNVGVETVRAWCKLHMIEHISAGYIDYLIPGNYKNPLEKTNDK